VALAGFDQGVLGQFRRHLPMKKYDLSWREVRRECELVVTSWQLLVTSWQLAVARCRASLSLLHFDPGLVDRSGADEIVYVHDPPEHHQFDVNVLCFVVDCVMPSPE